MTKEELLQKNSSEVLSSKTLLEFYIKYFHEEFGYKPVCAGCSFSDDWKKFKTKNKIMIDSNKDFKIKEPSKIYTYEKTVTYNGHEKQKTIHIYGRSMTNEIVKEYLTLGTEEQIALRKKDFIRLPNFITEPAAETEPETEPETETTENKKNVVTFEELKVLHPEFASAKSKKELLKMIDDSQKL
jgi:hypothetical protein